MKTQTFVAPSRGDIGEALLRLCHGADEHVTAGYYCALTICSHNGQRTVHIPRRVLLWALSSLGEKMTDCRLDVVAKGHAVRFEYRDMLNDAYVLGSYPAAAAQLVIRGLRDYSIKNIKLARREVSFFRRERERLQLENDFLRAYIENREAFALFVEGGAAL